MPHPPLSRGASLPAPHGRLVYAWALGMAALLGLMPQVTGAGSLTIGSISLEPAAEIKIFLPLARYLAQQLAPQGIAHAMGLVPSIAWLPPNGTTFGLALHIAMPIISWGSAIMAE